MRCLDMSSGRAQMGQTVASGSETKIRVRVQRNTMSERNQIITFLLEGCDAKNLIIAQLQAQVADLQKQLEELKKSA